MAVKKYVIAVNCTDHSQSPPKTMAIALPITGESLDEAREKAENLAFHRQEVLGFVPDETDAYAWRYPKPGDDSWKHL